MKIPFLNSANDPVANPPVEATPPSVPQRMPAQLFIFKNMALVGQQSIAKSTITIGSGATADVVLAHQDIMDIHASLFFDNDEVILSNRFPENGLRLNGKAVKLALLEPPGVIELGPYRIQVALGEPVPEAESVKADGPVIQDTPIETAAPEPQAKPVVTGAPTAVEQTAEIVVPVAETKSDEPLDEASRADAHLQASVDIETDGPDFSNVLQPVDVVEDEQNQTISEDPATANADYTLIWRGDIEPNRNRDIVCQQLAMLFRTSPGALMPIVSGYRVYTKKGLDQQTARRLQLALGKLGAIAQIVPGKNVTVGAVTPQPTVVERTSVRPPSSPIPATAPSRAVSTPESTDEEPFMPLVAENETPPPVVAKPIAPTPTHARTITEDTPQRRYVDFEWDDEDDEDEDDIEAAFQMREKLVPVLKGGHAPSSPKVSGQMVLEVVGMRRGTVVDVHHLHRNEKLFVDRDNRKFCLAAHDKRGGCFVSYHPTLGGEWQRGKEPATPLEQLKTDRYLHRSRKKIYRCELKATDRMTISDDHMVYAIRSVWLQPSPRVVTQENAEPVGWRYFASSSAFHVVCVLLIGWFAAFNVAPPEAEEPRFVQVDPTQLMAPQPPKPEPKKLAPKPKPKPKPVKVVPTKKTRPVKKKKRVPTRVRKAVPSKDPNAGGGYGKKGNIVNRDVNQAGILSMLGDGASSKNSSPTLLAAVTNLDAVASPGASEKSFTVGGVKGALGNGKIAMPTGEVIKTKGGKQVLRSYGAKGKGRVAALKKGKVGKKQVAGMVTAKLTKSVSIRGGLSMAEVKRVIDQHLSEVSYCYETALLNNPSIMGRIVYEWKILKSGRVGEVRIQNSSINSHDIHNCIKASIRSWQFPKPRGANEVYVSYPFIFDVVGF